MGEKRRAQSAAKINRGQRMRQSTCYPAGDLDGTLILEDQCGSIQNLRAHEQVNANDFQTAEREDFVDHAVQSLFINSERRSFATHPHRAAGRVGRVHPQGNLGDLTIMGGKLVDAPCFFDRLHMNFTNPRLQGSGQFVTRLAGAGKDQSLGWATGLQGLIQLAAGGDLQPTSLLQKQFQNRGVGIGLDRIIELKMRGQQRTRRFDLLQHHPLIVDE